MRLLLLVCLIAGGIYYVQRRAEVENVVGGPITLKMQSDEVLENHGQPTEIHSERGGREVWIYEDGRLVEFRGHEVIRSEIGRPDTQWVRMADGSWVRQPVGVTGRTSLANKATPSEATSASAKAREQWGWDKKGTALDQPAKSSKARDQ